MCEHVDCTANDPVVWGPEARGDNLPTAHPKFLVVRKSFCRNLLSENATFGPQNPQFWENLGAKGL